MERFATLVHPQRLCSNGKTTGHMASGIIEFHYQLQSLELNGYFYNMVWAYNAHNCVSCLWCLPLSQI